MPALRTTLQRTLTIHFAMVAILPILAFGLVAFTLLHNHLQHEVTANNQQLAEEIAASTEQFIQEIQRDLQVVARIIVAKAVDDATATDQLLTILVEKSGYFESIYLLDANRRVTHVGLDARVGMRREDYRSIDYSQHTLFYGRRLLSHPVWSDTFVSLATGQPSVTLAISAGHGMLLGNVSLLPALRDCLVAATRRYLKFISAIETPEFGLQQQQQVTETQTVNNHRYKGFNLLSEEDTWLLRTLLRGEFAVTGLTN